MFYRILDVPSDLKDNYILAQMSRRTTWDGSGPGSNPGSSRQLNNSSERIPHDQAAFHMFGLGHDNLHS